MIRDDDRAHFLRALQLADRGGRWTAPNPRVGALVVRDGRVVGEGWHRRAGEPHAEALALEAAGEASRGATLYCSLEPCAHHGRTPPCTDRVIRGGLARVVVGVVDPDPRVRGAGLEALTQAGITVDLVTGDLARLAERAIEDYLVHRREGRAFVALKAAATLDGRIADRSSRARWITGQEARLHGRALRDRYGAIVVGAGTVEADDPILLPPGGAGEGGPPFYRCVVDGLAEVSPHCRLLVEPAQGSPVLIYTAADAPHERVRALESAGAEVVVSESAGGWVAPEAIVRDLGRRGVLGAVVEGGGRTHGAFLDAGLADKLYWYLAPAVLGDPESIPSVASGARALEEARRFRIADVIRLEDDLLLALYPR